MKTVAGKIILVSVITLAGLSGLAAAQEKMQLTIQPGQATHAISPDMYGLFFEDINFAGDGGLYAELIQNRSFEFEEKLFNWTVVQRDGGEGAFQPVADTPLNGNNLNYARLVSNKDGQVGVTTNGYSGIPLKQGGAYPLSVYLRGVDGFAGPVTMQLETAGGEALGSCRIEAISSEWKKYESPITAGKDELKGRLTILLQGKGSVDIDMVSLFPEKVWKDQPNGLRADLVEKLAALKPAFIRFPGGCIVEGKTLDNAYRWKDTIGDPAERKINWNRWAGWNKPPQYYQSYGLGFYEFFRLCDDLGAQPLPILNCGMSCQYQDAQLVPLDQLEPYVQDALDLIEWATGPADSAWGAKRAAAGHPEPFNLKYLGVGNEQWDNVYFERYEIFYKAIKARYPQIQIVTTAGPSADGKWFDLAWGKFKTGTPGDIVDEHYYRTPQWFLSNTTRYDNYDRKGAKVFAGEYAGHQSDRRNDLQAAISEAAFITGLERNSDVVVMASYAPLLARLDYTQWAPDLIWFDATRTFGTPSYYVQQLYSLNRGANYVKHELKVSDTAQKPAGRVGLATWRTCVEYKDLRISRYRKTFSTFQDTTSWQTLSGNWKFLPGQAVQSDATVDGACCLIGDPQWSDYIFALKARKVSGNEGFMIVFRRDSQDNGLQWNLGGWGNTKHAIQSSADAAIITEKAGKIETGRWYDVEVELKGDEVICRLDGQVVHQLKIPVSRQPQLFVSTTADETGKLLYVKVVNPYPQAKTLQIELAGGVQPQNQASVTLLTGTQPDDVNSLEDPLKVSPREDSLTLAGPQFNYEFKPWSMTVLKINLK